jgi:hypothetical protein
VREASNDELAFVRAGENWWQAEVAHHHPERQDEAQRVQDCVVPRVTCVRFSDSRGHVFRISS